MIEASKELYSQTSLVWCLSDLISEEHLKVLDSKILTALGLGRDRQSSVINI